MARPVDPAARTRLALLIALPLSVALAIWLFARDAGQRVDWVQHTLVVELSLERLISDLQNVESEERGFLITGDARYLETARAAREASRREVASLDVLTADNPVQQQMLRRISPLVETRLAQFERTLELQKNGRSDEKSELDRSAQLIDSIESLAIDMRTSEDRLLTVRDRQLLATEARFVWSLAIGCTVILLVFAQMQRRTARYLKQRLEAEERLSRLNAELDQRVQERTATLTGREELLQVFVKSVPAAVAMLDRDMRYLQVSERWCSNYHVDPGSIIGHSHYEVFPDLPERWKAMHQRGLAGEVLQAQEDAWTRESGQVTWLHWEIRPWGLRNGVPEGILIFTEDITARKDSEEMLRETAATTQAILDTAAQGILAVDRAGNIVFANDVTATMFGYTLEELVGKPHEILVPAHCRERHIFYRAESAANPVTRPVGVGRELSGLRKDGSEFPIEISISSVETARGSLGIGCISDITARKDAEASLRSSERQLRELAGSLLTAQEDERRRLARELHDDLTQQLGFLAMELGRLAGQPGADPGLLVTGLRDLRQHALAVAADMRRLSHGLHPSVIEDFGLGIALEEFCDEFQKAQGVEVVFDGLIQDSHLGGAAATSLYRIAQEAMRNAVVHGRASTVHVTLDSAPDGTVRLRVADDGSGFELQQAREKASLGIVSMRERIRLIGGTLTISSQPGKGTEVTAVVPVPEAA